MTSYVEEMLQEQLAQLALDSPSREMYEIALMRLNETPKETGSETYIASTVPIRQEKINKTPGKG